mmetsp:Transcript_159728/g.281926  ORF Transcript_159728/g.281926 Transcript_159728/m.281926 type:complete len:123 (+) Transcript_159728:33-401(+)
MESSPEALAAVELVRKYYAAIAEHDACKMLECVSDDVEVKFLEPERNWSAKVVAAEKFSGWFERCPDVLVTWDLKEVKELSGTDVKPECAAIELVLSADFGSGAHGMRYVVRAGLISHIEHL